MFIINLSNTLSSCQLGYFFVNSFENKPLLGMIMTLAGVKETLKAELLTHKADLTREVKSVCASDLMSDVLAFNSPDILLLTGLINQQTIITVEIADAIGVVFVRGKRPNREVIALAEKKNIPLMTTGYCMHDASGLLFREGLPGITEQVKNFHKKNER